MKSIVSNCEIIVKKEIANNVFDFTVRSEEMSALCKSGQFLHINCGEKTFLRRPISICDAENGLIRFIFEVRGEGTKNLSDMCKGDSIDILGPLGNGFNKDTSKKALFVGGGIGIPPLLMPAKMYGKNATVLLGFKSLRHAFLVEEFKSAGCKVLVATDNGSLGIKGFVTDLIDECLKSDEIDKIYSCGPKPMLKKCSDIAQKNNIPCEISMEERMACGIGACLVCACKTKENENVHYKHVCKDGPVFDSRVVIFDE